MSWQDKLRQVEPYVAGEQPKINNMIKLNTNENPYGPCKQIKDILKGKLNVLCISTNNLSLKLVPISFKISKNTLSIKYIAFEGNISNINIYSDSYSIISDENNITLDILLNKGTDSNNNIILFYNLSKIIPLKFNDLYLEDNIYSLCNYILKKELSSL